MFSAADWLCLKSFNLILTGLQPGASSLDIFYFRTPLGVQCL